MRVPASPLLVFGFALAATDCWSAPASPAMVHSPRMPNSPAIPNSPSIPRSPALGHHHSNPGKRVPVGTGGDAYTGAGGSSLGGNRDDNNLGNEGGNLLGLGSNGAGNGGNSHSGSAYGGKGGVAAVYDQDGNLQSIDSGSGGDAFSGVGGNSNGGTLTTANSRNSRSLGTSGLFGQQDVSSQESAQNQDQNQDQTNQDSQDPELDGEFDQLEPYWDSLLGDTGGLNILNGNGGNGGDASSGSAVGGSAGSVVPSQYLSDPSRGNGLISIAGRVVSTRKGEIRRSRTVGLRDLSLDGLGLNGLDAQYGDMGENGANLLEDLNGLGLE